MAQLSRREFFNRSVGALAAGAALPGLAQEAGSAAPMAPQPVVPAAAGRVVLGKTGLSATLLGMGTGTKAWNKSSAQNRKGRETFVGNLIHAHERGLRYFDLADQYGSHEYMRDAIKEGGMDRGGLLILTKSNAVDAEGMRADLDRIRLEVGTDYLDAVLIHCMTEADWTTKMRPCMDVLSEAKERGIIKAHGVSCHSLDALKLAAETDWVELMLSRINPWGTKMDAPPEEVVPVLKRAHASGKGMLGMKIAGEGLHTDKIAESLRFVLGLGCIHAVTIGFVERGEIDGCINKMQEAFDIAPDGLSGAS